MKEKTNSNKLILLAVILYLLNATIFCFLIYPRIGTGMNLDFDGEGYQRIAFNILSGKGFFFGEGDDPVLRSYGRPTLLRAPLYPYFIALVYYLFGIKPVLVILFHIIINAFIIFAIYRIAKEVFDQKTAILASFISAFHPSFVWFLSRLYNENIFNFLLAFSMFYAVKVFYDLSFKNSVILGILLGISSLCKGQMIIFPLILLPGLLYIYRKEKIKLFKRFSLIFVFLLLTISPWTIRNYIVSGKIVLVQYGGGVHFMRGNEAVERNTGFSHQDHRSAMNIAFAKEEQIINRFESLNKRKMTEVELNDTFNKIVLNYIINNPLKFLEKILIGSLQFWYLGENKTKSLAMAVIQLPVLILGFLGFYSAYKQKIKLIIPLYSIILYFVLIHAAILPMSRYAVPILPYVIIFASFEIINLYNKVKNKAPAAERMGVEKL